VILLKDYMLYAGRTASASTSLRDIPRLIKRPVMLFRTPSFGSESPSGFSCYKAMVFDWLAEVHLCSKRTNILKIRTTRFSVFLPGLDPPGRWMFTMQSSHGRAIRLCITGRPVTRPPTEPVRSNHTPSIGQWMSAYCISDHGDYQHGFSQAEVHGMIKGK